MTYARLGGATCLDLEGALRILGGPLGPSRHLALLSLRLFPLLIQITVGSIAGEVQSCTRVASLQPIIVSQQLTQLLK